MDPSRFALHKLDYDLIVVFRIVVEMVLKVKRA